MLALLDPTLTNNLPRMRQWLSHAEATAHIMQESQSHITCEQQRLDITVEKNVLVQLENLKTHPVIAARLASGKLRLHGWIYNIKTGAVTAYEPSRGQFVPISEALEIPNRENKPRRSIEQGMPASQRPEQGHEHLPPVSMSH
jgi:carbonic anhydrase